MDKIRGHLAWVVPIGLAAFLLLLLGVGSMPAVQANIRGLLKEAAAMPYWALVAFTTVLITSCVLPTTLAALMLGALIGYDAVWVVLPSCALAILIHYSVFGMLPLAWRQRLLQSPKGQQLAKSLEAGGFGTIFLLRLSPVFPFALTNLMLRFFKFNLVQMLLGSLAGILPRTLLSVAIGASGGQVLGALGTRPWVVGVVMAVVSLAGLYFLVRGRRGEK